MAPIITVWSPRGVAFITFIIYQKHVIFFMTKGRLGIILCPMLDDNLMYSLEKDPEEKRIVVIKAENNRSIISKLGKAGIPYEVMDWDTDIVCNRRGPDGSDFGIIIYCTELGLHSRPADLKSRVEEITRKMQPYVDAIGFYLGTCGNYGWNIPKWCESEGLKPSAMFCDGNGELCHDCVGVNIAGGPRYLELEKRYTGHIFMFPAMATNYDDFMDADQANVEATEESLTPEMREVLGIEPGRDGYFRWLLQMGGYQHLLRLDTGIGDREHFEEDLQKIAERSRLTIIDAEPGWASLQPTEDLYRKCKEMIGGGTE